RFLNWRLPDMESLRQILSPDFLLRNSVYTSVLIGFACPLVGVFLVLRRLVFMGVALPQISSTGVAVALSVPLWLGAIQPALAAGTLALVLVALGLFHKELLFVSFDRAMAITLGKNVLWWDVLLYLLIGLTVSMAVLSVGPLIAFGFLLIPALTAHLFARNM